MKNKKDISSLKGLRINSYSYLLQTFCPYRDRQEGVYQKAFFTAYLFLWEGSPKPDFIGVWRRLLQSGGMEHGFCEIAILGAESGQEIENSLPGFFRIWDDF